MSYYTLPQHYIWLDWMVRSFGANLVKGGSFDDHAALESAGWINQSYQVEGITSKVLTVASEDDPGQRYLKMSVEPTEKRQLDSFAPFFDFPAAAIRDATDPGHRRAVPADLGACPKDESLGARAKGPHHPRLDRRRSPAIPLCPSRSPSSPR